MNKVKYLCSRINEKEWSGMLFYNIEGSIQDIKSMTITPIEIFLRDIGTKVSTDFDYDEECLEFVEENDLHMAKHGMIHSHNSMQVFFSPTDVEELQDNVANHNIYLSLVVNNFMDMVAKVVFLGQPSSYFSCIDENGESYDLELSEVEKTMFMYDCDIDVYQQKFSVSDTFKRTLEVVRKKSIDKNLAAQKANQARFANPSIQQQQATGPNGYNQWRGYEENFNEGFQGNFDHIEKIEDAESDDDYNIEYDEFFAYCLNGGCLTDSDILDIVEDIEDEKSGDQIVDQVISNYALYYENFFETDSFGTNEEEFKNCISQLIRMSESLERQYIWLKLLSVGLRLIAGKFEQLNLNQNDTDDTEV